MSPKNLINCLFFALLGQLATAQTIDLNMPARLSVCDQQSIEFAISASNGPIIAGDLIVQFPCGLQYVDGSVEGLEFKEMDANGKAVFLLPPMPSGEERLVSFKIFVDCSARACIDDGELFYLGFELVQGSNRIEILSEPFNIETGNLVIVRVDTLVMNGALHQTLTRRITVRNTRLGRIASFRFADEYSDQLNITQQSGWDIINSAGLRVSELRAENFRQVGNRDDFLDFGEEVVIEQTIRVISCAFDGRFARSNWTLEWGCGGETCGIARMHGQVNIQIYNVAGDVISFIPTRREPNCFYEGTAEQELRFNWRGIPLNIEDLFINIYTSQSGRGIIEGSLVADWADTIIYHNIRLNDCGNRLAERVTIRLSNLNLAVVGSRRITWLNGYCHTDFSELLEENWNFSYVYIKTCQFVQNESISNSSHENVERLIDFKAEINWPDDKLIPNGTYFEVEIEFFSNLFASYDEELIIKLTFPSAVVPENNDFSIGGIIPFEINSTLSGRNRVIELKYKTPLPISVNKLKVGLRVDCSAGSDYQCLPSIITTCPPEAICPLIESDQFKFELLFNSGGDCTQVGTLYIFEIVNRAVGCFEGICNEIMPGYANYSFDVIRTNFGLPDKDEDGLPDQDGVFDFDNMNLKQFLVGDTMKITFEGNLVIEREDVVFDELLFELRIFDQKIISSEDNVQSLQFLNLLLEKDSILNYSYSDFQYFNIKLNRWFSISNLPEIYLENGIQFFKVNKETFFNSLDIESDFIEFSNGDYFKLEIGKVINLNLASTVPNNIGNIVLHNITFKIRSRVTLGKAPINLYGRKLSCFCDEKEVMITGIGLRSFGFVRPFNSRCANDLSGTIEFVISPYFRTPKEIRSFRPIAIKFPNRETVKWSWVGFTNSSGIEESFNKEHRIDSTIFYFTENFPFQRQFSIGSRARINVKYSNLECVDFPIGSSQWDYAAFEFEVPKRLSPFLQNLRLNTPRVPLNNGSNLLRPQMILSNNLTTLNLNKHTIHNLNYNITNTLNNNREVDFFQVFGRVIDTPSGIRNLSFTNSSGQTIPFNGAYYHLGSFDGSTVFPYELPLTLHATSTSCQPEQIIIEYGYDCDVWTDPAKSPCLLRRDTIIIEVLPGLMDIQTQEAVRQTELCSSLSTQALYFNADLGHAYDVQAEVTLPRGMRIVPGSAVMIYPAGSGNELPIGDPEELNVRHFRWMMDEWMEEWIDEGLPGVQTIPGNDFEIRFDVETDCSYISGTRIIHTITGHKVCGQRTNRRAKVEAPIQINGVTAPYNLNLQASTSGSGSCGSTMLVQAQLNIPSGQEANIYLTLPIGMQYISGTATASSGLSGETQDGNIWSWKIMAGEGPITFLAEVIADTDCQEGLIELFTTAEAEAVCTATQQACPIEVVTGSRLLPIKIEKPSYSLVEVEMLLPEIPGQSSRIQVGLQHAGVLSFEVPEVDLYLDNNGNGTVDAGDDLLQTLRFNLFNAEGERQVRRFNLPDLAPEDYCRLLLDLSETNNCICEGQTVRLGSNVKLQLLDADLCHDEAVTIGVPSQPGYRYQWNDARGLSCTQCAEAVFQNINNGIFTETYRKVLRAESPTGCIVEYVFDLRVRPRAEILTGNLQVCKGEEIELIANIADSYHWTGDNIVENGQQILRVIARQSGYYYLEAGGLAQCDNRDSVFVEVLPSPAGQFPNGIQLCFGGSGEIGIVPEEGVRYEWVNGSGRLSALDIANPRVLIEEPFVFTLVSENAVCRTISEIPVDFYQAFEIEGLPFEVTSCVGDTVFLSLQGGESYTWSQDVTSFCQNANCSELTIPVLEGLLELSVEARDADGCIALGQITIEGTRDTLFQNSEKSLCEGEEWIWLDRFISESGVYCDTIILAGGCLQISCVEVEVFPLDYDVEEVQLCSGETFEYNGMVYSVGGLYCFTELGVNNCDSTHCISLEFRALPDIPLASEYTVLQDSELILELPATYEYYEWSPSELVDCSTCSRVSVRTTEDAFLQVIVQDDLGCESRMDIQLTIRRPCTAVTAPLINAFSPNDDGQNDTYRIDGLEDCGRVDIRVFNRWGNEVYRKDHYDNSWKGEAQNGRELPQGTYFIVLDYRDQGVIRQTTLDLRRK